MRSKRGIHVIPYSNGLATRKEGAQGAGSVDHTKAKTLSQARDKVRRERVEVVIHGKDGPNQDSDSFGNDPFPPKDRKR